MRRRGREHPGGPCSYSWAMPESPMRRGASLGGPKMRWMLCLAMFGLGSVSALALAQSPATPTPPVEHPIVREFGGYRAFTRPSRDSTMGFSQPTQVQEILVKGGQVVKKGELIIRGDDGEDQALLKLQRMRAETDLPIK